MSLIYIRAKEGRVARVSPKGEFIPHDRYIGVRVTPYISRLLNHHGDVELEPKKPRVEKEPEKVETSAPAVAKSETK